MQTNRFLSLILICTFFTFLYLTTAICLGAEKDMSSTFEHPSVNITEPPPKFSDISDNDAGTNKKTIIFVSFFLIDILNINTAEQTFKADFRLQLRWQDPRFTLPAHEKKDTRKNYNLEDIWHPDIRFLNSQKLEMLYDGFLEINEHGVVRNTQRYLGDFAVKFALKDFPKDIQKLFITITPGENFENIEFLFDPTWSGANEALTVAEWSITPEAMDSTPITITSIDSSQTLVIPSMSFLFKARRHAGYYTWKVIVPLTLIVLMAFAVFFIDPAELGAQVTISTASVITVVAFQFSLGFLLPKISYLTRIDTFVLGSTVFVFLALAESIVTSAVSAKKGNALARKIDVWLRWLFPASFILLFFISFFF